MLKSSGNLLSIEHDPFNQFEHMIYQFKAKTHGKATDITDDVNFSEMHQFIKTKKKIKENTLFLLQLLTYLLFSIILQ